MKIALAQINPIVGDLKGNRIKICDFIERSKQLGAGLVAFPEMALLGYPPEDLVLQQGFLEALNEEASKIASHTKDTVAIVGLIRKNETGGEKGLFNSAAIFENGKLIGYQDKSLLPEYDVFSERRYFEPAKEIRLWNLSGLKVAITICEDLWQHAGAVEYSSYPIDPVEFLRNLHPDLVINLSASPYYFRRYETRMIVSQKTAKTLNCPVALCNQVGGNDSLIFDGLSHFSSGKGEIVAAAKSFEEDLLLFDLQEKNPPLSLMLDPVEELHRALVLGIKDYFHKQGFKKACLGLSGGIDSALVASLAKEALGKENVLALFLPSRYSSSQSREDAICLSTNLGIEFQEISIEDPFEIFLSTLAPFFKASASDHTEENLQARIRGVLLMAFSNKFGYLLLNTGNKSEMAMGYATLYGDMCGGLAVLSDVTKEQVYALARKMNQLKEIIPNKIIEREPTAELRFNQKDTDTLPPYSILDPILNDYVEDRLSPKEIAEKRKLDLSLIKDLIKKIHLNEYKRRQAPPGLRVTKKAFSIGRRFPIVQKWNV